MSDRRTDRGALSCLTFHRCARGFMLMEGGLYSDGLPRTIYAFDRVEDLAAWLVEEYRENPFDCPTENAPQEGGAS